MAVVYGSCTGRSASKYNIWLDWNVVSQNSYYNESEVNVKVYVQRNDGYAASAFNNYANSCYKYTTCDGAEEDGIYGTLDTRNSAIVLLKETTLWVHHDTNGNKYINIAGGFTVTGLTSLTGGSVNTGSVSLGHIAKKPTYNSTSVETVTTTSAILSASINLYGNAVTQWGWCISTNSNMFNYTYYNNNGDYKNITGLSKNTKYYYQGYTATAAGAVYSGIGNFGTPNAVSKAITQSIGFKKSISTRTKRFNTIVKTNGCNINGMFGHNIIKTISNSIGVKELLLFNVNIKKIITNTIGFNHTMLHRMQEPEQIYIKKVMYGEVRIVQSLLGTELV